VGTPKGIGWSRTKASTRTIPLICDGRSAAAQTAAAPPKELPIRTTGFPRISGWSSNSSKSCPQSSGLWEVNPTSDSPRPRWSMATVVNPLLASRGRRSRSVESCKKDDNEAQMVFGKDGTLTFRLRISQRRDAHQNGCFALWRLFSRENVKGQPQITLLSNCKKLCRPKHDILCVVFRSNFSNSARYSISIMILLTPWQMTFTEKKPPNAIGKVALILRRKHTRDIAPHGQHRAVRVAGVQPFRNASDSLLSFRCCGIVRPCTMPLRERYEKAKSGYGVRYGSEICSPEK
jgi:hypothetical protein